MLGRKSIRAVVFMVIVLASTVLAAPAPQEVTAPGVDANTNAVDGSAVYIINAMDPKAPFQQK